MSSTYEKIISLYPQFLFVVLLYLCYARDISYAYALIGYPGNSIVNGLLKQMFRNVIGHAGDRPEPHHSSNGFDSFIASVWPQHKANTAYGFPSGHAQSMGYYLAFVHHFFPWRSWHPVAIFAHLIIATFLMQTRIAFRRHTFVQVLFGFLFGIVFFHVFHWFKVQG